MNPSLLTTLLASPISSPSPGLSTAAPWAGGGAAAGGAPSGLAFTRALNDARQAASPANDAARPPAPAREPEGRARSEGADRADRAERGENGGRSESGGRPGPAQRSEHDPAGSDTARRGTAPARSNDATRRTPAPTPARRDAAHGAASTAEGGARATRARTSSASEAEPEVNAPGRPGGRRGPGDAEAASSSAFAADASVAPRQAPPSEASDLARAADGRPAAAVHAAATDATTTADLLGAADARAPAGPAGAIDGSHALEGSGAGRAHGSAASARRAGDDGPSSGVVDPAALGLRAILAEATAAMTVAAESGDRTAAGPVGASTTSAVSGLLPAGALAATSHPAGAVAAGGVHEASLGATPGSDAFARELGAQISVFVREGVQQARLHLNPQELGPVMVRIQLEGQAAQVHMAADLPSTREALEQALPALAGQLSDAGITLAGGGVFERPPHGFGEHEARSDEARRPAEPGSGTAEQTTAGALPTEPARWSRPRGLVDLVA